MSEYLECGIHAFKTHVSRHIDALEQAEYKGIVVKRGRKKVAMLIPLKPAPRSAPVVGVTPAGGVADLVRNSD